MTSSARPGMKRFVQFAVLGLMAGGAVAIGAAPATAAGESGKVNNCYTQWWNTAWAQKCTNDGASVAGYYRSTVSCQAQVGSSIRPYRNKGSVGPVSGADCTFKVLSGTIGYEGK